MAKTAARKQAAPPQVEHAPPQMEPETDKVYDNATYDYFCIKVLPNALPINAAKRKLMEKQTPDESKLQLSILDHVIELNVLLKDKPSSELFKNQACKAMYNTLTNLQTSQHFAGQGWKAIAFPCMIPMTHEIRIFASLVYQTKSCPLFFQWSLSEMADKPVHTDLKLNPILNIENVEQQNGQPLVEKPTSGNIIENDWPQQQDLEMILNDSNGSSIDAGVTILPSNDSIFPLIDVNDISCVDLTGMDDITPNSYVDASYNPIRPAKRKLNLSKVDKLKILEIESMAQKIQSTPIPSRPQPSRTLNVPKPQLSRTLKRSYDRKERPQEAPKNYLTQFLAGWFKKQIPNISAELEKELQSRNPQ